MVSVTGGLNCCLTVRSLMQGGSLRKLRMENLSISCLRGAFGVEATGTRSSSSLRYATSSSRIGSLAFCSHCLTFPTWNGVALERDLRSIRSSRNLSDLPLVGMLQPDSMHMVSWAAYDISQSLAKALWLFQLSLTVGHSEKSHYPDHLVWLSRLHPSALFLAPRSDPVSTRLILR